MVKHFCDLCGRPEQPQANIAAKATTVTVGTIVVRAIWTLEGHPTGFGGPPDLCGDCRVAMLKSLVAQYEAAEGPAKETP
jgi:hypothetical protein